MEDKLGERIARLETIINQHEERIEKIENHLTDMLKHTAKLEEAINIIEDKIKDMDKKLWGIVTGIIFTILLLIIRLLI